MATLNKWSALVWVIQEPHECPLAVVIVLVGLHLAIVPLHPYILEITHELQQDSSQFFFTWGDSRGLFYLKMFEDANRSFPCFSSELRLFWDILINPTSSTLCSEGSCVNLFLLWVFTSGFPLTFFLGTLYWQNTIKGLYFCWELDPLIWRKNKYCCELLNQIDHSSPSQIHLHFKHMM